MDGYDFRTSSHMYVSRQVADFSSYTSCALPNIPPILWMAKMDLDFACVYICLHLSHAVSKF